MTEAIPVSNGRIRITNLRSTAKASFELPKSGWRYPSMRQRMLIVAAVYAAAGFLAGATVGAFVGWFLPFACVGALLGGVAGARLEHRK